MKATCIESSGFTEWVVRHWPDEAYSALQRQLMGNPDTGRVMKGCGGLRKVRAGDPRRGKGTRGGVRVIYFYVPESNWFFMLDIYDKNEKDDLSARERKQLARLAAKLRMQALAAIERSQRGRS